MAAYWVFKTSPSLALKINPTCKPLNNCLDCIIWHITAQHVIIQNKELTNECSTQEVYLWNLILKRSTLNGSNETATYIHSVHFPVTKTAWKCTSLCPSCPSICTEILHHTTLMQHLIMLQTVTGSKDIYILHFSGKASLLQCNVYMLCISNTAIFTQSKNVQILECQYGKHHIQPSENSGDPGIRPHLSTAMFTCLLKFKY